VNEIQCTRCSNSSALSLLDISEAQETSMHDNPALLEMRRNHAPVGLVAEDALAWHEVGHALAAAIVNRLQKVTLKPCSSALGGQVAFDRSSIDFETDLFIAAMGTAGQMAYVRLCQKVEPSTFLIDQYVWGPARGDLKDLQRYWPGKIVAEEAFFELIHALSLEIEKTTTISGVFGSGAKALRERQELSSQEVEALLTERRAALLKLWEQAKSLINSIDSRSPAATEL
jgi:hypothetical protein